MANTTYLSGIRVARSADAAQREEAVPMLLKVQRDWDSLPESQAAAVA